MNSSKVNNNTNIAVDASNIKAGGGLTHLKQLVGNYHGNDVALNIIGGAWLNKIDDKPWVKKMIIPKVFKNLIKQEYFKRSALPKILNKSDVIFVPGGTFKSKKKPYVSMSQNMLVFEEKERNRFPKSFNWLRYIILERLQVKSFKNAAGIIYISHYAKNYIEGKYPVLKDKKSTVIYHGISNQFRSLPKIQKELSEYTFENPFKLLYVSIINFYKHQWNVVNAVKKLRNEGFPISLELIGPINESCRSKLEESLKNSELFISYLGKVNYEDISESYKRADLFIFASTCENMPNILVEAMSAGLPILSSDYGPMPEVLQDGGLYMNPTNVNSIYTELKKILLDKDIRQEIAEKAYSISQNFSWEKTSNRTFSFIREVHYLNSVKN